MTSSYLVLANDAAGSTEQAAVGRAVARLAEHAPVQLRWTSSTDEFRDTIVATDDDQQVVVAGGDGSIHLALRIADELDRCDRPIGIIPLGTGNDFARNHGISLDPVEAADCIVAGGVRSLDVIELRGGDAEIALVANNVHFGIGVDSARRAQGLKPALGRFAYPAATAWEGLTGDATRVRVEADGDVTWDGPALAVLVLLGPNMGGGVPVVDGPPDGIDLVVIGDVEVRDRAELALAVRRGELEERSDVVRRSATEIVLTGAEGSTTIGADVDGELLDLDTPVTMRLREQAWRVLLPVGDRQSR